VTIFTGGKKATREGQPVARGGARSAATGWLNAVAFFNNKFIFLDYYAFSRPMMALIITAKLR
jgi:hypothetical protein